jgi:predicted O-methyltransferase YrrM
MTVYNDQISKYIVDLFVVQDQALLHTLEDSPLQGLPTINVKPEEGRFLQVLVRACGIKKAVEIGTLGGYSGTWIARGLVPGGRLITLEKEPRHAAIARKHFKEAGLENVVEIRVGDAHESLRGLVQAGPFDFVFIDAEKTGYPAYLDWALENVRLGGLIGVHNAFRKGSVAGVAQKDEYTEIMQGFNQRVANEPRLLTTIFPAGDGMLVAVKIA